MSRLSWDDTEKQYYLGIDRGVFYPQNGSAEAWNGLVSVSDTSETDTIIRYIDGLKFQNRRKSEDFSGVLEAFTYPNSFYEHVLLQRASHSFGLSYRIRTSNSYDIHLIYNVTMSPPGQIYKQAETEPFSWDFTTKPVKVPEAKPSAHLVVKSATAYSWVLAEFEDILYGSDSTYARLPTPEEIFNLFEKNALLRVIDHGDGTFTVTGPDEAIQMIDTTTFEITWPSAVMLDSVSYKISSL